MSRKEILRNTYKQYFDRLEKLALSLEKIKEAAGALPPGEQRVAMEKYVEDLENEIETYAQFVSQSGIDIIKKVA